jgi:membrane protein required for beta-lactamase induction
MAGAVVAAMVLTLLLPKDVRPGPSWLLPTIEGVLLVAVIASDPGRITRRSKEIRALSIALVAVLALGTMWATAELIDALINGGSITDSASDLLEAGAVVWLSNCIAFALLYWELDGGGAAARAHHLPTFRTWPSRSRATRASRCQAGGRASSTTSTSRSRTRPRSARPT